MYSYCEVRNGFINLQTYKEFTKSEDVVKHALAIWYENQKDDWDYMDVKVCDCKTHHDPWALCVRKTWENFQMEMEGLTAIIESQERYGFSLLDALPHADDWPKESP